LVSNTSLAKVLLSSCISFSPTNLSAFLDGQGIELVLRCLKERVHAGVCGLKLLDFFGGESIHKEACEHLVTAGGLKYLFPMFLGSRIPKPALFSVKAEKKAKREWLAIVQTQLVRIMYALSRHLDEESPEDAKVRFLSKFVQDDRKCDRLAELLLLYDEKARKAEYNFYRSDVEEQVDEEETVQLAAMESKLKGGGELFHRVGAITACVCVNSKRRHEHLLSQLQMQQSGIGLVKASLEEFLSVLGEGSQKEEIKFYLKNI
jgi:beta-catenin-like protein 1